MIHNLCVTVILQCYIYFTSTLIVKYFEKLRVNAIKTVGIMSCENSTFPILRMQAVNITHSQLKRSRNDMRERSLPEMGENICS